MKSKYIIFSLVSLLFSCNSGPTFVHNYNYKTIIDDSFNKNEYNHFDNKIFEGLCEINYGFMKSTELIKTYNTDGTLIVRSGPPFTFSIELDRLNQDIEYIEIDTIELVTKSGIYDLLSLKDISYQTSIYYRGRFKEKNYDPSPWFWEMDNFQTLQQLKEERSVNINGLRLKGIAKIKKRIEESENDYNEEEIKLLLEERRFIFKFIIEHIPINVDNDEEVIVKINLLCTMSNGNIQRIQFDNVYLREYVRSSNQRFIFVDFLPREENVKF